MNCNTLLAWSRPVLCLVLVSSTLAQDRYITGDHYAKTELTIPMRDGTELFTQIYEPLDDSRTYPVMLFRTPYGVRFYGEGLNWITLGPSPLFTRSGYIFV